MDGEGGDGSGAPPHGEVQDATEHGAEPHDDPRRGPLARLATLNGTVGLLLGLVGLRIGLAPLHDNSFFTHLATGRLILDGGGIPRHDPYSYTALGEPWTVQSWGASVIFAGIEDLLGLAGIRALVATCTTLLALLVWRLTRPAGSIVGRLLLAAPAIAIGTGLWVERPLLFGLLLLGVVLIAAEGDLDPRWCVPALYLWVNLHGSFPLAFVAIGALLVGRLLDRQRPEVEGRVLLWATVGTLLGALNPLGLRLLRFPFDLLGRREAFGRIVEWQPPEWIDGSERAFAVQLAVAVVLVLWRGRSWRNVVPVVVFAAMSLQSTRNIVQASLVMLIPMAASAKGLGTIDGSRAMPVLRPVVAALGALAVLVAGVGLAGPDTELEDYPVEAAAWMRDEGHLDLDDRVVHRDFVGNYLEVRYGPDEVRVFIDDRVDMYPIEVIDDYSTLISPNGDYGGVLDRAGATAVLWDVDSDFGDWLEDPANGWDIVHRDELWMVALPAAG